MEKKFTLMKTLTALSAFCDLLFSRSKKNPHAVNNSSTSTTGGCGTTTVNDRLIYVNDPYKSGSFLFFNQAADSQQSAVDSPQSMDNQQKLKSKEELKKVNDELAQRNIPKPANNNWRQRVNDDLAACSPVVSRESVIVSRESITVINVLKNIFPTSTVHNETRTKKNDSVLAGSFSFLKRFFTGVISAPQHKPGLMQNFRQPQYRPIPIISNHSNMKKFLRKPGLFSIALIFIFLVAAISANATNYFSGSSGDPNSTLVWWTNTNGTGTHPANFTSAGDAFFIQSGHNMSTTTNWTVAGSLTIQSGGILTINSGNTSVSLGAFTINSGGSATVNRPFTVTGATTISGTINFGTTTAGTARAIAFNGAVILNSGTVWDETSGGANTTADTYTFGNSFTNNATTFTTLATSPHTFSGTTQTLAGTTSMPLVAITGSYTNNGTLTVGTTLSGGGSLTNAASQTLNIGGTITLTTLTATASNNTVNYTGAAQTIKVTAYAKLGLSGSGNKTFGAGITIASNLSISGTAIAALGNNNFSTLTLTIGGVGQAAGTYGSTASAATFKLSGSFGTTGTGILTVTQQSCTPPTINGTLSLCGGLTTQLSSPDAPAVSNAWISATTTVATIDNNGLVTGVSTGTTVITFTNSTGCTNTATVTVNATPTTSSTKNDVQCFNTNTGTIVITAIGGTAPYTYSIDNGANYLNNGGTFNGLGIGNYKIRVKDANQCQSKSVQ